MEKGLTMKNVLNRVIDALKAWKYTQCKATPYMISREIGASESAVVKALRVLKDEGIVKKSTMGSSWVIVPNPEAG
jgi:hypothetical protein